MLDADFIGGRLMTDLKLGMHQVGDEVFSKSIITDPLTGVPLDLTTPSTVVGATAVGVVPTTPPVLFGFIGRTGLPNPGIDASLVLPVGTRNGYLVVRPKTIPDLEWSFASPTGGIIAAGNTTLRLGSGSAFFRCYTDSFQFINTGAVATEFSITAAAGGAILWLGVAPANMTQWVTVLLDIPVKTPANVLVNLNVATAGAKLYFNAQGHIES